MSSQGGDNGRQSQGGDDGGRSQGVTLSRAIRTKAHDETERGRNQGVASSPND